MNAPDIVLLGKNWNPRALLRAELAEQGFEVVASDTWDDAARHISVRARPRLALVDLEGLDDPVAVLRELRLLMGPRPVLVLTALDTLPPAEVERLGCRALARPVSIGDIVSAAARAIAESR